MIRSNAIVIVIALYGMSVSCEQSDGADRNSNDMVLNILEKLDEFQKSNSDNAQSLQTQLRELNLKQDRLENSVNRLRILSEDVKKLETSNAISLKILFDKVRILQITKNSGLLVYEASKTGNTYRLRLLLDSDAPINYTDAQGNRPIHVATKNVHLEALRILLNNQADTEEHGEFKYTPLHWASHKNCFECAKILLGRGASVFSRDFLKETPLLKAAKYGYTDLVKLLLEYGAEINDTEADGSTALHLASKGGKLATVQFLIEHNANLTARNILRETALDLALSHNHYDVGDFLKSTLDRRS